MYVEKNTYMIRHVNNIQKDLDRYSILNTDVGFSYFLVLIFTRKPHLREEYKPLSDFNNKKTLYESL